MPKAAKARAVVESDSDVEQVEPQPASKRSNKRKASPVAAAAAGPSKRKAVAPSDALARLQTKHDELQQLLTQERELNKELLQIRSTEPEDRLSELVVAAEDRRLQFQKQNDLYKNEIVELKKQVKELEEAETARLETSKPAPSSSDAGRLRTENEALRKQLKRAEGRGDAKGAPADNGKADGRVAELEAEVAQLRRELETETAQSKALLQRKQTQRTGDQPTNAEKLTAELLTDLTGLTITSVEENPSDGIFVTYRCLLTDSRPMTKPGAVRLSLRFSLSFDEEACFGFKPELDPRNDALMIDRLKAVDPTWLAAFRFSRGSSFQFFRKLLTVVYDGPKKPIQPPA